MRTQEPLRNELRELMTADAQGLDFLQNTLLDGLWCWDLRTPENEWVNARFWHTLGYAPAQVPTDPAAWRATLDPADLVAARQQLARCLADPTLPYEHLGRYARRDGSTAWLRCQGLIVRDAAATPLRLVGALRDVTAETQAAATARDVAAHYGAMLNNQSVYIIKTDAFGHYTYVNDFFIERFGGDSKTIGTSSLASIVEEDHPKCLAAVRQCFAAPEVPHQVILRKPYLDSSTKSSHWEFKGLRGEQGDVVEILCVGYDVTLLVENLEKSQQLLAVTSQQNTRLQDFAYIVSHNIRSHSANLTSLVQLLTESKSAEKKALFLRLLRTSTEKLTETIANLHDIITVHGDAPQPWEARLLGEEIDKTLEALSALLCPDTMAVHVRVPADLTVTVVPAYLDSVLLNLISNAVKYRSPDRPLQLVLTAHREPGFVVLTVRDNGLGFDVVKNRSKLFGMYKTFHDNEDARGIGLFITKNQLESMLGKIDVQSQVGVGTTFTVYFYEES